MELLQVIELFGGIGAFTSALDRLNKSYKVVDYVDNDPYAVKSYNAIHDFNFEPQDIAEWNREFKNIDIIMSGSPCQSISVIGKNKGADEGSGTRSSLMWENVRIAKAIKPKVLIWENVKGLLTKRHIHNYEKYKNKLEEIGYKNYTLILNAANFGVPQQRIRVFTVSILNNSGVKFNYRIHDKVNSTIDSVLEKEVNKKYYLSDEAQRVLKENTELTGNGVKMLSIRTPFIAAARGRNKFNPNDRTVGQKGLIQRLEPKEDRISYTLTTVQKDNYVIDVNREIRKLTPLESWRLMGFTDEEFKKAEAVVSESQLIKQAGNSIVVNCLIYILSMLEVE